MQANGHVSSGSESSDNAELEGWEDWTEPEAACVSLVDQTTLENVEAALQYDREHGLDLIELIRRLQLDFYGQIRLINWLREAIEQLDATAPFLRDDRWLKPVIPNDPLLQLDLDDYDGPSAQPSSSSDGRIAQLEAALAAKAQELESLHLLVRQRFADDDSDEEGPIAGPSRPRDDDTHYFKSYSELEIHEQMLSDRVRTEAYRDFIERNADLFAGKTVLDVGCGTGILSMFAARAGAKKVYAVDASDIVSKAERNVRENGLDAIIEVRRGKIEQLELPQVDIIISEWMGYALLYESMLDSVLDSRHFLKLDGLMVPSQCSMLVAAIDASELLDRPKKFWSDQYGFKMNAMAENLYDDALIEVVPADSLMSEPCALRDLHVQRMSVRDVDFDSHFELDISRDGVIRGLCIWFDTFFTRDGDLVDSLALERSQLPSSVTAFTTSPRGTPTHWKQAVFVFRNSLPVKKDARLSGRLDLRKSVDNTRELEVTIDCSLTESTRILQVWRVR